MKFISAFKAERNIAQLLAEPDANTPTARKALDSLKGGGAGAIPVLIDAFASADRHQTIGIVDALAELISDRTIYEVVKGLSHPNERCVQGAAWAMSSSRNFNANKLTKIITRDDVATHAVLEIMRSHLDRLRVGDLVKTAYQLEPREKAALFKMVREKATEDLVPDLIARLSGHDHSARAHIIEILAKFNRPDVITAFEGLLSDGNRQVRGAALEALGDLNTVTNIQQVCALLKDPDLDVQNKAVEVVIKLRHPDTVKHLVPILQDESEYARRSAVEVLNELADHNTIKFLLVAIGDGDWWVRSRACDALASIGGPKVLQSVMQLINDDDENIRRSAIEILNQTKDEAAVAHLIKATHDEDWWVCERAVDALAEIGDSQAVPRLLEMLDGNPKAIPSVLRAMGKIGDTQVVPKVLPLLQRPEPEIVGEAAKALGMLVDTSNHDQLRSQIRPLLKSGNTTIATIARDSMESIDNRFSESAIMADEKAAKMSEPAHTMLIEGSDMHRLEQQLAADAAQVDLSQLNTGDLIENRYKYIEKIGKGAFGTVILVEDTVVDERLILKFLNANVANDEEMLKRFVHELRFSRKITHKNVIRIYDFLKLGGSYAISMEYFPSHTLGAEVAGDTPLPPEKAASWAKDIATGMAVAHQVGIIHRDLKPANLLIDDDGLLKIVDFGVAAASGSGDTQLTKTGYVIGSPKYMAPEQILGKQVDHRSDIYSLGVIFYEMLTGTPPYTKGDHMAVMYQHVQGKCARCDELNPDIPKELADIVHKAMEIDKMKRFESMNEMRAAISEVI